MGTSSTTLAGSAMARKTGTRRYEGVVRRGRKWRRRRRTSIETTRRDKRAKALEPRDDFMLQLVHVFRVSSHLTTRSSVAYS